jgi:hypothetical protein
LAWLVGNWHCAGNYNDVSLALPTGPVPVTVAHPDTALFHVALGVSGAWIKGQYQETQAALPGNPLTAPIAVDDGLSIDPTGTGIRSFIDSHTGQLQATFTTDSAGGIDWTGVYTVAGLALPFTEHLNRGAGDDSFTLDSRLGVGPGGTPVTFQIQTCTPL